jgi:glycosyltransferase involved in cell wall biosynthesis
LEQTLCSFANQTCKDFTIYIGDDATPADVEGIVDKFKEEIDIRYFRFPKRLGNSDLVAHWERCVQLARSERWIWLFSDDDVADAECVESFYKTIEEFGTTYSVLRFNSVVIGSDGKVKRICPPHPRVEHPMLFAYHRLMSDRYSYAQDHIFLRDAYETHGGFVTFPAAWGTDDASWIEFAGESGIFTVQGPLVRWRMSSISGSSPRLETRRKKIEANILFLKWLEQKFSQTRVDRLELDARVLIEVSKRWLVSQFVQQSARRLYWDFPHWVREMDGLYHDGLWNNVKRIIKVEAKILWRMLRRA